MIKKLYLICNFM